MPSQPRIIDPDGGMYHVICRGNNKAPVFKHEDDFLTFKEIVSARKRELPFLLHDYSLMTNHLHLKLSPESDTSLATLMQCINQDYSRYFKKTYQFTGHLWQGRYKSFLITTEKYALTCGIYIGLNPVRAGLASSPENYRWSSSRILMEGAKDPLITPDQSYLELGMTEGQRQSNYGDIVKMWMEKPMNKKEAKRFFKRGPVSLHPDL